MAGAEECQDHAPYHGSCERRGLVERRDRVMAGRCEPPGGVLCRAGFTLDGRSTRCGWRSSGHDMSPASPRRPDRICRTGCRGGFSSQAHSTAPSLVGRAVKGSVPDRSAHPRGRAGRGDIPGKGQGHDSRSRVLSTEPHEPCDGRGLARVLSAGVDAARGDVENSTPYQDAQGSLKRRVDDQQSKEGCSHHLGVVTCLKQARGPSIRQKNRPST